MSTSLSAPVRGRVRGWVVQLAVVAAVTALVCAQSWFYVDDWLMALILPNMSVPEMLGYSYFGHFMPGFAVAQRLFWDTFGPSWLAASVITALILCAASLAARRVVESTVDRPGPWGFVAGLMVPLSLSFLMCAGWWSATMQPLVPAVAGVSVVGCATRYYRTGRARHLVGLALVDTLAMSFFEKSAIYAAFAGLWCLLVVHVGGARAVLAQVVRRWPAWAVLAVVDAVFLILYVRGDYAGSVVPASGALTAEFAGRAVGLAVVPATFGLDLVRVPQALVVPLAVVAALMLTAIWVVLIRRHRGNRVVLAFWVVMLLVAELPLAVGRSGLLGLDAGRQLRYQLDASALTLMALAVAAVRARVLELGRHRAGRTAFIGLLVLLMTGTTYSAVVTLRQYPATSARAWHEAFTATWPTTGTVRVVDGPMAAPIAPDWLYPFSRSHLLPKMVDNVEFVDQLEGSMAVGPDGRVGPAEFKAEVTLGPGRCTPRAMLDSVALTSQPGADYDIRVTVVAAAPTPARVLVGNASLQPAAVRKSPTLPAGRSTVLTWWSTKPPVDTIGVHGASANVCIEKVELGHIVPR